MFFFIWIKIVFFLFEKSCLGSIIIHLFLKSLFSTINIVFGAPEQRLLPFEMTDGGLQIHSKNLSRIITGIFYLPSRGYIFCSSFFCFLVAKNMTRFFFCFLVAKKMTRYFLLSFFCKQGNCFLFLLTFYFRPSETLHSFLHIECIEGTLKPFATIEPWW